MHHIDNNHRTLKRNDDKFYMLSINPSGEEQSHLIEKVTGKKVGEFSELTAGEQEEVLAELKKISRGCMDEYARNFYREKIKSGDDLVWYGRVETERHYKGDDPEVEAGKAKAGERKPGLQLHVHIIVSRMDKTQTVSLSPLSKSRGNRQILDGKEVIVGFDRSQWSTRCASCFNRQYDYFPYYHSLDESLRKYSENWQLRNELKNQAVSQLKQEVLHGELKEERRLYTNTFRLYRFVVNPKKAIIRELKKMGTDLLTEVSGRSHPDMFQINRKELIQSLIQRSTYCLSAPLAETNAYKLIVDCNIFMGIDTMVPIPNNLYIFDKTTQKTVFVSAINEYLKKECINIFRDLNANDFKNSLEKQVLTYTKGNVERSFERILSPTGWGLKEYVPLKKGY